MFDDKIAFVFSLVRVGFFIGFRRLRFRRFRRDLPARWRVPGLCPFDKNTQP
jgi:hypothetical protein